MNTMENQIENQKENRVENNPYVRNDKEMEMDRDMEAVLGILENFSRTETSRMKLQVVEADNRLSNGEETDVSVTSYVHQEYHHGRCDVGSPWAQGKSFDILEEG